MFVSNVFSLHVQYNFLCSSCIYVCMHMYTTKIITCKYIYTCRYKGTRMIISLSINDYVFVVGSSCKKCLFSLFDLFFKCFYEKDFFYQNFVTLSCYYCCFVYIDIEFLF